MKRTGSQIITELLLRQGIDTVAGIPGGGNLPLYDAMGQSRMRHILTRHEQGAGFLAQGAARVTGRPAVCMGTSGPGATNLLTAIADAKLDSVPLVAITGQVPTAMMGTDAFQEVDMYGLTLPITKHNFLVRETAELLDVLPEAFAIAASGRPGPVAVDIPKDVQTGEIEFDAWPEPGEAAPLPACDPSQVARLAQMIRQAERPVLYVGGGIIASGCTGDLRLLARKNSLPVTHTLMGIGAFPSDDPLSLGMLGMHGQRATNLLMEETDLIIAIGVRFDDRATGKVREFCPQATIAHVDVDRSEIDKLRSSNISITGDACDLLRQLLPLVEDNARNAWISRLDELRALNPERRCPEGDPRHPRCLIAEFARHMDEDDIVATDVGQHQMWVAQHYPFRRPRRLLTSGGLGTMGFGLPAAIGAAVARPDKHVLCVSGDGSIMMNIQELATLRELGANVTVVIFENGHLGLVRQQQELFYGGRYNAVRFEAVPDFAALARAFGIQSFDLGRTGDPADMLAEAMRVQGPCVVAAPIHETENVYPMVPPGAANREMIGGETHA
jgi:acetolactate synthase-1/2/3 large subunit